MTRPSRERRLQVLCDRAGQRWSRRVHARIAARRDPSVERLRLLEDEAEVLFLRLKEMAPADPMLVALRDAKPEPDHSEWEEDES